MNSIQASAYDTAQIGHDLRRPINIYHMHPLVAGPLATWSGQFKRIHAMGFCHVCIASPFEPGANGEVFTHAKFDRLHAALGFNGSADEGLRFAAQQAADAGLHLMLDIAPGHIAADSTLFKQHPEWFSTRSVGEVADPRRPPHMMDTVSPRFGDSAIADELAGWWIELLSRFVGLGVTGFRCLTLDLTGATFWRNVRSALPKALFLAWTPGVSNLFEFSGVGFDLSCSSAGWDGRAPWFFNEQAALQDIAPALASPEASFSDRLVRRLTSQAKVIESYRLALQMAAATGSGLFMPMGFEHATRHRFDRVFATPEDMELAAQEGVADLSSDVRAAIDLNRDLPPAGCLRLITSPASPVTGFLRSQALILINPDVVHSAPIEFDLHPLPYTAGQPLVANGETKSPLRPGEVRAIPCHPTNNICVASEELSRHWAEANRIAIEAVDPSGDFPNKTVVGRAFTVGADVFGDGHDKLAVDLLWRAADTASWNRVSMSHDTNDRWHATIHPDRIGLYVFCVEGWWDQWATFTHDLHAKVAANQDVRLEIEEGKELVRAAGVSIAAEPIADWMLSESLAAEMKKVDSRPLAARSSTYSVRVDRQAAEFASWYELFPRSVTSDPGTHGTFGSVIGRLSRIRAMGFDVLYFPPIHPIGRINRKGRNNSLRAEEGDVGSPYAIGGVEGGHDSVHPSLGTIDDFRKLLQAARANGLELAIDFAVQCAPDHPWVSEHRDWFRWRPDGSMRYAENPPKKYEDIVNPDFYGDASFPAMWHALRNVIQFWVDQGVRIFRVDNPHTKPLPFWHWMITDIQGRHPDVLFLSEAFTRPKLMYRLAKVGFSQSYTYFTWRNTKQEIIEYLTEITKPPPSHFFRPNFFVNTPDINPIFLQTSGRPGFLIRAALAATLSGLWGVYSGFEICEAAPLPGREEYLNSEKYEIRTRDYLAPGNIC